MKKTNNYFLMFLLTLFCALTFVACTDDEPTNKPPNEQNSEPWNRDPVNVEMNDAEVRGMVRDSDGNPLSDVTVSTGSLTTMTNNAGMFSFEQVGSVNNRSVIQFSKSGYFSVSRSSVRTDEVMIDVMLHRKGNSDISTQESFDASAGKTISVGDMQVKISGSSIVQADGTVYSGNVNADMLYLDPNNEGFRELMPGGDLAGIRTDNSQSQLISYGMTEVSLTDNAGNPLQLDENASSELTFPIPEGMRSNPPSTIPLWYFDDEMGIWVEEGLAELRGSVYVGEIRHFSWHNLDYPEDRVTIKGKVTDCENRPLKGIKVVVDQVSDITDSNGNYSVFVPANTPVTVKVLSRDYLDYSPEVSHSIPGKSGNSTVTQDISLPCTPSTGGQVVNSCGTLAAAYVWIEYTHNGAKYETPRQWVDVSGAFDIRVPSNVNGQATLYAETLNGARASKTITLEGGDLLNISIELCMDLSESALTITPQGGTPVVIPIEWENVMVVATDNSLSMINGSEFVLEVPNYSKGKTSYDDVTIVVANSTIMFTSKSAHIDIISHTDERIKLSVSGTGDCFDLTTATQTTGSIGGILDAAVTTFSTGTKYNVTNWSDVGLPSSFPALPTPIDLVAGMTSPLRVISLYYKNATQTNYDNVNNILAGAFGEGSDISEGGDPTMFYWADEYMITVQYAPNGISVEGSTYQLMVGVIY